MYASMILTNSRLYALVIVFVFINFSIVFLLNEFILTDKIYYGSLSDSMSISQVDTFLQFQKKYNWVSYIILPFIILLKLGVTCTVLYVGYMLNGLKTHFKEIFHIVVACAYVPLVSPLITVLWFRYIQIDYTLQDVQYFYPLSLLNFFDPKSIDPLWIYPLQTVNAFEIAYWFALAYGIWRLTKTSFENAFFSVTKSYLPALVIWVAFIMFLTVTLSPA